MEESPWGKEKKKAKAFYQPGKEVWCKTSQQAEVPTNRYDALLSASLAAARRSLSCVTPENFGNVSLDWYIPATPVSGTRHDL